MAAVTKFRLAEEILRILNGGNIPFATKVRKEDVYVAISQVANTLLKATYMQDLKTGAAIPPGAMMAWYPGVSLTSANGACTCTLAAAPVYLLRDAGLSIYDPTIPNYEFIPVEHGMPGLINDHALLNSLLSPYYTRRGLTVTFSTDLTLLGKTKVDIAMCVLDISQYSEWDTLPVYADMELAIKQGVLALLGVQMQPSDKLVNFNKEQRQPIQTQQQT